MTENRIIPNPDCRDGKHASCSGSGLDLVSDQAVACPCPCHRTEEPATAAPKEEEAAPVEWAVWPPPLASRAIRRHCAHMVKAGYCALCGTKV